ncbi:MAG TPA: amidohydrolase family protein [Kofleriaceae bacterium]
MLRRSLSILSLSLLACGGSNPPPAPTPPTPPPAPAQPGPVALRAGDVAITHVTVVTMADGAAPLADHTVIVRGDRILAVAPSAAFGALPAGVIVHDGKQAWLMPGLTDMHVHLFGESDLTLLLAAGVTTVRNMFGNETHLAMRARIAKGELAGPTILTAGPIIDGNPPVWPGSDVLTDPAAADALVAKQQQAGYDFLKPYARLSRPAYDALVAAGAKYHMALEGHVPEAVGLRGVLAAKQKSVEHMDGWLTALVPDNVVLPADHTARAKLALAKADDARLPELIKATLDAGTWSCPTLVVLDRIGALDNLKLLQGRVGWLPLVSPITIASWDPKRDFRLAAYKAEDFARVRATVARNAKLLKALVDAGGPFLVGTDTGNPYVVPGAALHDEIELLVAAGIPRPRVMRAATADAAVFAGTPHAFGVIEPGARADLLLVPSDPMAGPIPLVPAAVVARGAWLSQAELQGRLDAIAAKLAVPDEHKDYWKGAAPPAVTGAPVLVATYDLAIAGTKVGEERLAMTGAANQRTIVAQEAIVAQGRIDLGYSIAPGRTKFTAAFGPARLVLDGVLDGGKLTATGTDFKGQPLALSEPLPKGGFLTAGGAGGGLVLADQLAGLPVGGVRTLDGLELDTNPHVGIFVLHYVVERKPDAAGNRVYSYTVSQAGTTVTGGLVLDGKGLVSMSYGPPLSLTITRH